MGASPTLPQPPRPLSGLSVALGTSHAGGVPIVSGALADSSHLLMQPTTQGGGKKSLAAQPTIGRLCSEVGRVSWGSASDWCSTSMECPWCDVEPGKWSGQQCDCPCPLWQAPVRTKPPSLVVNYLFSYLCLHNRFRIKHVFFIGK